jgi:hypothetical protein
VETLRFPQVREALGFVDNAPLHDALRRFKIPHVALNTRVKALTATNFALLLQRATQELSSEP